MGAFFRSDNTIILRIPSAFFLGVCTYLLFMRLSFIWVFPTALLVLGKTATDIRRARSLHIWERLQCLIWAHVCDQRVRCFALVAATYRNEWNEINPSEKNLAYDLACVLRV